jgi:GNAT superfamily N-acetyltransferase
MAPDLLRRACEAVRALAALGGENLAHPLATFVRDGSRPQVWDANHVGAIRASSAREIEALFGACDAWFPPAIRHRQFRCDPFTPQGFVAQLEWAGFEPRVTVQMLLEGPLRGAVPELEIREAESEADWDSHARLVRAEAVDAAEREGRAPYAEEISRGLAELRCSGAPEVRVLLARLDGQDCGTFAAWPGREGVGVVEWLFTRPDQRRRGVAKALVAHAVADARARGAGAVLIGPDGGAYDLPRRFYATLGFRPLCVTRIYTRSG